METEKLKKALQNPFEVPVFYFASTEQEMLKEAASYVHNEIEKSGQADFTRVDGPAPDLGQVIAAAGAISFFGTPRVVEVLEISLSSMTDKDVNELALLFEQAENAVIVVTSLYKDKRTSTSKKAKNLFEKANKAGFAAVLEKPSRQENLRMIEEHAKEMQTDFERGASDALLLRAGDNRVLLRTETEKLAAISGYSKITKKMVEKFGALNIEADVFELARLITANRMGAVFEKIAELLQKKHEPIAISAALAGTFIDMMRVRVGTEKGRAVSVIFKELGYKGNDYRLKKALENAAKYSTHALAQSIICLAKLDKALKSSALQNKSILLEASVAQLVLFGGRT